MQSREDFTADGTDGTDKSRLVPNHFQPVKSVKSVVKLLWLLLCRSGRFLSAKASATADAHCCGNSIEMPFHEPFMNHLPIPASQANQAQSRLIKLFSVFRKSWVVGTPRCPDTSGVAQRANPANPLALVTGALPLAVALVLALFLMNHTVLAGGVPLPVPVVRDEPGGQALAEQIRSATPEKNSVIHGVFLINSGKTKRQVPVVCEVKLAGGTWETIYQADATSTAGAERLAIIHRTNGPNQYLYARAAKPGAPLPEASPVLPAATEAPFAGSDFSLGEFGLEFLHWPGQCKLKSEMRLGQPCYVLESTNSLKAGIVRVKSWIDEESLGLLVAEAYDGEGNKIKEFSLDSKSFKKDARGRWQLEEMGIDNKKTHSHTDLKFDMPKD